jgi:translation initiation factor 3 subunit F
MLIFFPVDLLKAVPTPSPALPPLPTLSSSLAQLDDLLTQTLEYVQKVTSGQEAGDPEVGRYILENVGRWSSGQGGEESGVKEGLQDTLTVSYLASLVRSQVELSGRLGLVVQQQQQAQ